MIDCVPVNRKVYSARCVHDLLDLCLTTAAELEDSWWIDRDDRVTPLSLPLAIDKLLNGVSYRLSADPISSTVNAYALSPNPPIYTTVIESTLTITCLYTISSHQEYSHPYTSVTHQPTAHHAHKRTYPPPPALSSRDRHRPSPSPLASRCPTDSEEIPLLWPIPSSQDIRSC
jgi:hypothetical protein